MQLHHDRWVSAAIGTLLYFGVTSHIRNSSVPNTGSPHIHRFFWIVDAVRLHQQVGKFSYSLHDSNVPESRSAESSEHRGPERF